MTYLFYHTRPVITRCNLSRRRSAVLGPPIYFLFFKLSAAPDFIVGQTGDIMILLSTKQIRRDGGPSRDEE